MTEQPIAPAPQPAPASAPVPPAPATTAPTATDPAAELARVTAELDQWKGHSRSWEAKAKANLEAAQQAAANKELLAKVAQTLGLEGAAPDPAQIQQQLAAAQAEKAQLARERAVLLAASSAGADPLALLDSRQFLSALEGIDPANTAAVTDAVKAAVAANPRYAAATTAPAATAPVRQANVAGDFNGSPGGQRQWTAADIAKATPAEVTKAMNAHLLDDYMAS
jgi:hypothetical protein